MSLIGERKRRRLLEVGAICLVAAGRVRRNAGDRLVASLRSAQ